MSYSVYILNDGRIEITFFNQNGWPSRDEKDGPARIEMNPSTNLLVLEYYKDGQLNRTIKVQEGRIVSCGGLTSEAMNDFSCANAMKEFAILSNTAKVCTKYEKGFCCTN